MFVLQGVMKMWRILCERPVNKMSASFHLEVNNYV